MNFWSKYVQLRIEFYYYGTTGSNSGSKQAIYLDPTKSQIDNRA
jgi:hypothetical protein